MERSIYDRDVVGCVLTNSVVWAEKGYCQIFWSDEDIVHEREDGKKLLDTTQSKTTLIEQEKTVKLYWDIVDELLKAVETNVPNKEQGEIYDRYSYALRRIYAHFITSTEYPSFAIEHKLRELLQLKYKGDVEEAHATLTTPSDKDLLIEEKEEWCKLLKGEISDAKILQHYKKYSVVLANIFSEKEVLKLAEQRIKSEAGHAIEKELLESENRRNELIKTKCELYKEIGSELVQEYSSFLCEAALLRLKLKACWNGESFHLLPFFEKIAQLTQSSVRDAYMVYTRQEVSDLLNRSVILPKAILEERRNYCLLHFHDNKIDIYNGAKALIAKREILEPHLPNEITSFKGSIANKGRIVGRARIVKVDNPHAIIEIANILKPGDILVTGMTNPTMMILVKKVKGIITDEGGVACHAAIISREFGLPCIVGTHVATHVLHDGDLIELDANNGIVRKLSEEEYFQG
ncbi:MAG: hypothetical protein HYW05_01495 [Candidatus Diapherotrites archaeon]|nr:hypothetical protein [Candidatus Diapherotrites archaeon]